MILGVGTDLLDIRRLERTLERWGERFCARVYTDVERRRCEDHVNRAARYAQRYAAKEACAKALGTGFREGVAWRDMEVDNLISGKPFLRLSGGAAARLALLTPAGLRPSVELSLTDEYPFAHAIVVISALPPAAPASRQR
ncbi:MAG TPA: holo-ACP synthase [Rhodospirillales bacterium]|nr:holo-ACP synthase [Rhodospirillales bacterium]